MWDIAMALNFVKQNIRQLGGDPEQVRVCHDQRNFQFENIYYGCFLKRYLTNIYDATRTPQELHPEHRE